MSAGRHLDQPLVPQATAIRQLNRTLQDPRVLRRLAQPFRLSLDYDIPYLAGYSLDGHIIYIDRHCPREVMVGQRLVAIYRFLITHERTEKALMDGLGMDYSHAHSMAEANEHMRVRTSGIDQVQYELALLPLIKADEVERVTRVPLDLDLSPYREDPLPGVLEHIQQCMEQQRTRQPRTPAEPHPHELLP